MAHKWPKVCVCGKKPKFYIFMKSTFNILCDCGRHLAHRYRRVAVAMWNKGLKEPAEGRDVAQER